MCFLNAVCLECVNGPFPFPLWKIKALLTAGILFNLVLCEMIFDDLSPHVPFMLKCFFIKEVSIVIAPLHTLLARTHQLYIADWIERKNESLTLSVHSHCQYMLSPDEKKSNCMFIVHQHLPQNLLTGVIWCQPLCTPCHVGEWMNHLCQATVSWHLWYVWHHRPCYFFPLITETHITNGS